MASGHHDSSLRLELTTTENGPAVRLVVDGRNLRDWVHAVESSFAESLAGAYGPLPADELLPPSRHLLGKPSPLYAGADGRTILLVCECGEPGCCPLEAGIAVTDSTVTWSDFRHPHRPTWNYEGLGPFVFDRADYDAVIDSHRARAPRGPGRHHGELGCRSVGSGRHSGDRARPVRARLRSGGPLPNVVAPSSEQVAFGRPRSRWLS